MFRKEYDQKILDEIKSHDWGNFGQAVVSICLLLWVLMLCGCGIWLLVMIFF